MLTTSPTYNRVVLEEKGFKTVTPLEAMMKYGLDASDFDELAVLAKDDLIIVACREKADDTYFVEVIVCNDHQMDEEQFTGREAAFLIACL